MCLVVNVHRFGTEAKTFFVRGFEICIGHDRFGRITAAEPVSPLISLQWRGESYRLTGDGVPEELEIDRQHVVQIAEYRFEIQAIDPWSELLAFSASDCSRQRGRFVCEISVGPHRRRYPLPLSGRVTLGSDSAAAIFHPLAAAQAVELRCESDRVIARSECEEIQQAVVLEGQELLRLKGSGAAVLLEAVC